MKRFISILTVFVIMAVTIGQSFAYSESTEDVYASVNITIPAQEGDLEQAFRNYVKGVADMYFGELYTLNSYYYTAANIKNDWDQGNSVQDNPYSTYEINSNSILYLKCAILESLIDSLKIKVDSMNMIPMDQYFVGLEFDASSGKWKLGDSAILSQQIYNEEILGKIDESLIALKSDLANSLADIGIAIGTKGMPDEKITDLVNSVTSFLTDVFTKFSEKMTENTIAILKNELRETMTKAFIEVNQNLDTKLLDTLRVEANNLLPYSSDPEANLRYEVINDLLEEIEKVYDNESLSADATALIEASAESLMEDLDIEVSPVLSLEEVTQATIQEVFFSLIRELTEWLIQSLELVNSDTSKEILQKMTSSAVKMAEDNYIGESEFTDLNCNGIIGLEEALAGIFEYFFSTDNIESIVNTIILTMQEENIFDAKQQALVSEWHEYANQIALAWGDYYLGMKYDSLSDDTANSILDYVESKREKMSVNQEMQKKLEEMREDNNLGSAGAFIDDILNICEDTYEYSKKVWSIGDMADHEIFFANIACKMYYEKESASTMRSVIANNYSAYQYHSTIDTASISDLKDFVNCVYSVYERDKTGHKYYVELLAGWLYQTSDQRIQDLEMEKYDNYANIIETFGGWGNAYVVVFGPVIDTIYVLLEKSTSEYLKALDKAEVWIEPEKAVMTYFYISNCANRAEIPDVYSDLINSTDN